MLGWGCVTRMGVLENVEVLGYHISNIELVLMGRLYRSLNVQSPHHQYVVSSLYINMAIHLCVRRQET